MSRLLWIFSTIVALITFYHITALVDDLQHEHDIFLWKMNTWTMANFQRWDWKMNVESFIDTPTSAGKFLYLWLRDPSAIGPGELYDQISGFIDTFWDYLMLYHKGVLMEVNGLWLQHKYDKALKRLWSYMTRGFLEVVGW